MPKVVLERWMSTLLVLSTVALFSGNEMRMLMHKNYGPHINSFDCEGEEVIEYQSLALKKYDMIGQAGMNRLMTKDNIALGVILKTKPNNPIVFNSNTSMHSW